MVRSLWTAATGMVAQQTNVDVISNNLANINTVGYKKESAEFKSLLYQNLQQKTTDNNGDPKPIPAQVGLGVRNSAVVSRFTQGTFQNTEKQLDYAIEGDGFFQVSLPNGTVGYTRNGAFEIGLLEEGYTISTAEGYPLMGIDGNPIVISDDYVSTRISLDSDGDVCYTDMDGNITRIGLKVQIVQFSNPSGLGKASDNILLQTPASGDAMSEEAGGLKRSALRQGYLESSNVEAVDEMVNLIVAQRAYEMNSKIITASDEMMQQANNLRS
ncbi:MAG: flagellar basal-body rod protein FlgG [Lachnospiraceae bacterium]|nr:flagellar basal-body rod protein FlgG [Lachnospiraceae bacterium]